MPASRASRGSSGGRAGGTRSASHTRSCHPALPVAGGASPGRLSTRAWRDRREVVAVAVRGRPYSGRMAKAAAVQYACSECGTATARWLGRCPGCGSFGTLVEESATRLSHGPAAKALLRLVEVQVEEAERIPTGVEELDRVLGGGLVPASLVLVGGEPGVGKSTLLLSALAAMSTTRHALLI